jgi:hypothetical protein
MNQEHDSSPHRTESDQPAASEAAKDLRAYYQDEAKEPAWQDAIRGLSAAEVTRRAQAASYLRDLLDQALKDELAGVDPRQPSLAWGQGPMSKARGLRESVAAALAKAEPTPSVLPVMRWFLEHEKLTTLQGETLKVIIRLQGAEADALLLELATKPHPNAEVAITALAQVGERKLRVTGGQLAVLCQHHRRKLREAARALNAQLGFPASPPFEPVHAIQSEPIRRLMDEIGRLLEQPVPADAPFVRLTSTYRADDTGGSRKWLESEPTTVRGWLLSEDGESWLLLTPHGRCNTYRKTGQNATVALARVPIEQEVARIAVLRGQGDEKFELSSRGSFSGQFEGHVAGEYEALLAQWLYAGKRYELAVAILLPALDTLLLDSHLADITRDRLGTLYGQQMLAAFVGDRDYAKTERLAKWIAKRFPGTSYYRDAVRLLDELPRRRDDFKTLRLPTPAEWAAQRKTMSRREQIDFLCRRLRLLNCFQGGQPGGPMYDEPQYAEPCGITPDAAWGLNQGKTELINPLSELVGPLYAGQRAPRTEGLRVTVEDIPALAAHLREDWYQLTVSFWRDFAPGRTLERTRSELVFIINHIAGHELCDAEKLNTMTDKQLDAEILRLSRWAEANRGKDETALLLQHLEDALKSGTPWFRLNHQVARLAELKAKAAVPLLFRFVEEDRVEPRDIPEIRRWCDNIAPAVLQEVARKALEHADDKVRKRVALLDLDKDEAALLLRDLETEFQNPCSWSGAHGGYSAILGDGETRFGHRRVVRRTAAVELTYLEKGDGRRQDGAGVYRGARGARKQFKGCVAPAAKTQDYHLYGRLGVGQVFAGV